MSTVSFERRAWNAALSAPVPNKCELGQLA